MTSKDFNALLRLMGRKALENEEALIVVYERAVRKAGAFYARQFSRSAITAAGDWVAPAGEPEFDSNLALEAARERREEAALAIESVLVERVAEIAVSFDPADFKVFSPDLLGALGQQAGANFDAKMRDTLAATVRESFDQGLSVPDTAKAITSRIDGVSRSAATMLARTDLISLANGGAYMAATTIFAGVEISKKWINAHDARVRPSHANAGGQVVPMDKPFRVGGFELMYPGDPQGPPGEVINCRCTFVSVESDGDESSAETFPIRTTAARQTGDAMGVPKGEMAQTIFGDALDTEALYFNAATKSWSPARRPLHEGIIARFLEDGRPVPSNQRPRTMFLAGGSGAGKSTVKNALDNRPANAVDVDPDAIKELLPEYRAMVEVRDKYAAVGVHEESSAISKQILKDANDRRSNVLVDGTGDAEPGKFLDKIRAQQATGNDVEVVLVDIPTEEAIKRVNARAAKSGRHIDEAVVREIHQSVSARFSEWRDTVDWQLWANESRPPRLIARRQQGVEYIYDESRFKEMIEKADG